jgi:hypothetical protein
MKDWHVAWHSKEIYGSPAVLRVVEYPWWALIPERIAEKLDFRHWLCSPPEWTFAIPLRRKYDHECEMWDTSAGTVIFHAFQRAMSFSRERETIRHEVDLTGEWLDEHGFSDPWPEDEDA